MVFGEINSLMVIPISFARSVRKDLAPNPMNKERTRIPTNKRVKREKKTWLICGWEIRVVEDYANILRPGNHEPVTSCEGGDGKEG